MAIVKMHKVTLYGIARQRDEVLDRLQRLGCLHLIDLQARADAKAPEHPHRSVVRDALKYLNACPVQNSNQLTHYEHDCDCLEVAHRALEIQRRRQQLNDERDILVRSIETLEPWGDFELPSEQQLGGLRLWFYPIRRRQLPTMRPQPRCPSRAPW
ncbi:MAG: V-type ATP synthase subunit I, partial [Planctomycetes bacterium]|nr:V-type ATP synthase subunit I [Planctomycetota bacterium]